MRKTNTFIIALLLHFCSGAFAQTKNLAFIENKNQWEPVIRYKANIPGGAVFITDAGFTYSFYNTKDMKEGHEKENEHKDLLDDTSRLIRMHAYRVTLVNADLKNIHYSEKERRKECYNFFLGNDRTKWAGKVAAFETVIKHDVYKNIDMKIYSNSASMKYDFIVSPDADPSQIILNFEGVKPLLTKEGSLRIETSVNEITEGAPICYQWMDGNKKFVKSKYRQLQNGNIMFEFPEGYDSSKTLIIDPSLVFTTYSGGTPETFGICATYDQQGATFSAGSSRNTGWPVTMGAFQQNFGGLTDVAINKYAADGSNLIYSTYYGGSAGDLILDMKANANNELALMGITASANLPTTPGCYDNIYGGGFDFFVARLSEDGTMLLGATYVGGSGAESPDVNESQVEIDNNGNFVIVGNTESNDFPVSALAAQPVYGGIQDGVVFKISSNCTQLLYSTYLGGSTRDMCLGVTLNNQNDIIVCGRTNSQNFPVTAGALFTTAPGDDDGFVSVINNVTGALSASTYLGTTITDWAYRVQLDENQNIVVLGQMWGVAVFPVSQGAFNVPGGDVYLYRLNPGLSVALQSTRIGAPAGGPNGSQGITFTPTAFRNDLECGNIYIAGKGVMSDMPVTNDAYNATANTGLYFCVLDSDWQNLLYGSYFDMDFVCFHGFNADFDAVGNLYHPICTDNPALPTTPGVFAPAIQSAGFDNAVLKFNMNVSHAPIVTLNDTVVCNNMPFSVTASSANGDNYQWGPPGAIISAPDQPTVTVDPSVSTEITVVVTSGSCGSASDTMHITISDSDFVHAVIQPGDTAICPGDTILLIASGTGAVSYVWNAAQNMDVNDETAKVWPEENSTYHVTVRDAHGCQSEATANVRISAVPDIDAGFDIDIAYGESAQLNGQATGSAFWTYNVNPPNILNPFVKPDTTTTYYLTATGPKGCKAIDSVTVYVISTGMPNAFSPNGDGLNDVFKPIFSNYSRFVPLSFSVYNRWGERIFYTPHIKDGWDGTFKSKPVDAGTYYYYVEYTIGAKKFILKGDVTLIR